MQAFNICNATNTWHTILCHAMHLLLIKSLPFRVLPDSFIFQRHSQSYYNWCTSRYAVTFSNNIIIRNTSCIGNQCCQTKNFI